MEQIAVFQDKVVISPIDLHSDVGSFDEIILAKLKKQLEGKCSRHGFVIPGSLEMLSRSMGICEKGRAPYLSQAPLRPHAGTGQLRLWRHSHTNT